MGYNGKNYRIYWAKTIENVWKMLKNYGIYWAKLWDIVGKKYGI